MALVSIRQGESLEIVDQLLLPHTVRYVKIDTVEEAHEAIKSMKIRGAPAIASLAALAFAQHLKRSNETSASFLATTDQFKIHVDETLAFLYTARPTAVNLGHATRRLGKVLDQGIEQGQTVSQLVELLIKEAHAVSDEDVGRNKAMARWGGDWLGERSGKGLLNVLTVCNTGSLATSGYGTALGLITYLHETGQLGTAYFTQTAPYHQGSRLTAMELQALKISSVMICDTMVGSLFQHHPIHAVVVGADRIAKNGDTANKIGTYNAAVLAARHRIPFIVVAPIATIDLAISDGSSIPIEHRPPLEACLVRGALYPFTNETEKELVQVMITPDGLEGVYNPSFDVTPAELITAIVTEKGVAIKREGQVGFDLSEVV